MTWEDLTIMQAVMMLCWWAARAELGGVIMFAASVFFGVCATLLALS